MEPHELEALADRLAIEDLLTRYAHAVDRHDWDLYRSVFTDDAASPGPWTKRCRFSRPRCRFSR